MPEAIAYAVTEGVATIALNRPDRLNAMNPVMFGELMAAFDETDADDDVRAVVVTGAGRAFCAGADLGRGAQTFNYGDRPASARGRLGATTPRTPADIVGTDAGGRPPGPPADIASAA
jgi:enoyl-CoA hydratase/carnithine racemase